jgi:hypothetical protein
MLQTLRSSARETPQADRSAIVDTDIVGWYTRCDSDNRITMKIPAVVRDVASVF